MAPRELDDATDIDRDDDMDEMPYAKLMEMLGEDDPAPDEEAFGTLSEPKAEDAPVSVEEGLDLIEGAEAGKRKAAKVEAAPEAKPEPDAKAEEPALDAKPEGESAPEPESDIDALIGGLDEAARTTIKARVTAADEVLGIFKGREAELQSLGVTPVQAMSELVKINTYARSKPDEYLTWAAGQFGDPADMLGKAAERIGFKLVPLEEDDPFEDPDIKALREENRRLKAGQAPQDFGPDAPANRAQTDLQAFIADKKDQWEEVAPVVAAMATARSKKTNAPVTMKDIAGFFQKAVEDLQGDAQPAKTTPAAQSQQPVAQQQQKPAAATASVERAKAASRSLDGSGQGAGRRPDIDPDASLSSVLSKLYDAQTKG